MTKSQLKELIKEVLNDGHDEVLPDNNPAGHNSGRPISNIKYPKTPPNISKTFTFYKFNEVKPTSPGGKSKPYLLNFGTRDWKIGTWSDTYKCFITDRGHQVRPILWSELK